MGRGIANAGNNDWSLNLYPSGKTGFYYYSSASTPYNVVLGSLTVNLSSWNHLAMCYSNSGSTLSLYLNGTLSTSAAKSGTQTYSSTYDFVIGALTPYASNTNPGFVGLGPALVTDIRTIKGTAVYSGSTYTIPTAPLTSVNNTVLLLRALKSGAYMTGTNVGINQINPTFPLDVAGTVRVGSLTSPGMVSGWVPASLMNGWVNYGSNWTPCGYLLDPMGFVHLRGLVRNGSSATSVIFSLPSNLFPKYTHIFSASASDAWAEIRVDLNGTIYLSSGSANAWVCLDGIHYSLLS